MKLLFFFLEISHLAMFFSVRWWLLYEEKFVVILFLLGITTKNNFLHIIVSLIMYECYCLAIALLRLLCNETNAMKPESAMQ